MRLAIISDTNTSEALDKVYNYFITFATEYKIDGVVINGDILGIFNAKQEYGQKVEDYTSFFKSAAPYTCENLINVIQKVKQGKELDQEGLVQLSNYIDDYIDERYMFVIHSLRKFSKICKVYFNLGNHESPLHDYLIQELSFVFGIEKDMINKIINQTNERNHFESFKTKLKQMENEENFVFISQKVVLENGVLITGIPGLHIESHLNDEKSSAQENVTKSTLDEVKKNMIKAKALLIFNHVEGKINSSPFLLQPSSESMTDFLDNTSSTIPKLFCQSNSSFKTTHFYKKNVWYYLLNNAGVNNGLFNVIDIIENIICYDIDPNLGQITKLTEYDLDNVEYHQPVERLKLNYPNAEVIITQRMLDNSMSNL